MRQIIMMFLLAAISSSVTAQNTVVVTVSNPTNSPRADVPIIINTSPYSEVRSALVTQNGQEIPCQLDDLNLDESFDELC